MKDVINGSGSLVCKSTKRNSCFDFEGRGNYDCRLNRVPLLGEIIARVLMTLSNLPDDLQMETPQELCRLSIESTGDG